MMKYGAFTQIAIAIIAVVIVFTYVRPTFLEIGEIQDKIAEFDTAIEQVSGVNNQLNALVGQVNGVSVADRQRLLTYLPDLIDDVAILRDVKAMMDEAGVEITSLSYSGFETPSGPGEEESALLPEPVVHTFQIGLSGEYGAVKQVLRYLEENDYPLHVYNLTIAPTESEVVGAEEVEATLEIETYSRIEPEQFTAGGSQRSRRSR